jgi:YHS domain-containing protein
VVAEATGQSGTRSGRFARRRPAAESTAPAVGHSLVARPVLALEGNDPVTLRREDKLVAGDANRASTFDCQGYRFASDANKQAFDADPKRFVPVLAGDSIIAWTQQHRLAVGSVKFRAVHDERLYLFGSEAEKAQFLAAPAKFKDGDVLLGGVSPVALVDEEAIKRGSAQFADLFEGRRVLHASADEKARFRANAGKYFPTLAGIDPVSFLEGKPQPGSADYSVVYKNRLYLFASGESRTRFIEAPQTYSDVDVALNGACPVVFVETHELANGHYGISTVCLGRRYLFQSDEHRKKFADDPTRYVMALGSREQ